VNFTTLIAISLARIFVSISDIILTLFKPSLYHCNR